MARDAASAVSAAPGWTLAAALVESLRRLGVAQAFGVPGGAMALVWHALSSSRLQVCHFRHESGAAFAAAEASFASRRPTVVFTTAGPGLLNALTGLVAARDTGAKVILLSACSSAPARGRGAIQETWQATMPSDLYSSGPVFHFAAMLEDAPGFVDAMRAVAGGLSRAGAFVAHLAIPTAVQTLPALPLAIGPQAASAAAELHPAVSSALPSALRALVDDSFAIWVGFGAGAAAAEIRKLAERTGAAVFCTPRGKGIMPETHPLFIGVTGMGGHESVTDWLADQRPARILVLGSRLGEASSSWDARFVPRRGFVHIDIDANVPGTAFPGDACDAVIGDVGAMLRRLLDVLPDSCVGPPATGCFPPSLEPPGPVASDRVRPEALMDALQRQVIDTGDAILLAESGNAFIWTTHRLRFATAGRYRASTGFGAMGHAAAGVVGAALGGGRRAVAVVGDAAMLMNNEINTAVKYDAPATWIVLNDARYGMCAQGMESLGLSADARFPEVDFAAFARSQGAAGLRVAQESELDEALQRAMRSQGPFVLDVLIDPNALAPSGSRNRALARQLQGAPPVEFSFPDR